MLYVWHNQDPVDNKEVDRNNAIFAIQQNRNPYIDNPQWVDAIWGPSAAVADAGDPQPRLWAVDNRLLRSTAVPAHVDVLDATGRLVWSGTWPAGVSELELPRLAGLCLARVDGSDGVAVCPYFSGN